MASLIWLGHSAFRLETDTGKHIYIDPFLTHNPKTPEQLQALTEAEVAMLQPGDAVGIG